METKLYRPAGSFMASSEFKWLSKMLIAENNVNMVSSFIKIISLLHMVKGQKGVYSGKVEWPFCVKAQ